MARPIDCLLIDDDHDDLDIFVMCLEKLEGDINCVTKDDSTEAIELLQSATSYIPDYIFMDMNMPKLNGIACLQILRGIQRLNNTRIYMYSTTAENAVVAESERLGATGFIMKPAKIAELKMILSDIFFGKSDQNRQYP